MTIDVGEKVWFYDPQYDGHDAPKAPAKVTKVHWQGNAQRPAQVDLVAGKPDVNEFVTNVVCFETDPREIIWAEDSKPKYADGYPGGHAVKAKEDDPVPEFAA